MITLKNDEQIFEAETFLELYLKKKEPDCILYSKEGVKFNVHKEILYQTELMKNILLDDHGQFSQSIEIFCPCSDKEIESILNFLYNGSISCYQEDEVSKILNNLTKLFGFPGKLFTVEDRSMWNNSSSIKVEKIQTQNVHLFIPYDVTFHQFKITVPDCHMFINFDFINDIDHLTKLIVFIQYGREPSTNDYNFKIRD